MVARRPRVLPQASTTYHLRLMSLPLGMVVLLFIWCLLPGSAVFIGRRGSEERSIDFYCGLLLLLFAANCCQLVRADGEIKIRSGAEGFVDEKENLLKDKRAGPLGFAQSLGRGLEEWGSGMLLCGFSTEPDLWTGLLNLWTSEP